MEQYLTPDGVLIKPRPSWVTDRWLIQTYQDMLLMRVFDKKAIALQRTGQLGTYPSIEGQEAIGVAIGHTMRAEDVLCPYYREAAAQYLRGVQLADILSYWGGRETPLDGQAPNEDLPICVPIASQTLHAVGVASAFKYRQAPRVAVTCIGDGGTSRGDFYEAMNVASLWYLPVVFVINNNQWAISTPLQSQTNVSGLIQKAQAANLPAKQVDGNDILAMAEEMRLALARARANKGAFVIEAMTYRLGDHTTADDATRYRAAEEVARAQNHAPIPRLQRYLHQQGLWSPEQEKAALKQAHDIVNAQVAKYLAYPPHAPERMFHYRYASDAPMTTTEKTHV